MVGLRLGPGERVGQQLGSGVGLKLGLGLREGRELKRAYAGEPVTVEPVTSL